MIEYFFKQTDMKNEKLPVCLFWMDELKPLTKYREDFFLIHCYGRMRCTKRSGRVVQSQVLWDWVMRSGHNPIYWRKLFFTDNYKINFHVIEIFIIFEPCSNIFYCFFDPFILFSIFSISIIN